MIEPDTLAEDIWVYPCVVRPGMCNYVVQAAGESYLHTKLGDCRREPVPHIAKRGQKVTKIRVFDKAKSVFKPWI